MNWSNIIVVYRKELKDSLRDRRTLLSMIVIPTVIMPAIMFGFGFLMMKAVKKASIETPAITIIGGADSPEVVAALAAHPKITLIPFSAGWKQLVSDKKIRAAVEIPDGFQAALARGEPTTTRIYHYEGELKSGFAVGELRRFFTELREKTVAARLADRGLPPTLIRPFEIQTRNVAPPERVGGNLLGGFLPYLFIVLCFIGGMHPAIDLTAGEKERGTLETILCSSISRSDLVLGKFLMVLTASLATVAFSLVSLMGSFLAGGSAFLFGKTGGAAAAAKGLVTGTAPLLDPAGVLAVIAMVFPMAVLFAAVQLTVALFAKSHKEAQSYLAPLILIILLPAIVGLMPGVELNTKLALVPVLNLSLVSKELVSGVWHWHYISLIFSSTCLYAAAALAVCVRTFNREDVIFRT
jgi:sodium transport system permease protein